MSNKAHTQAFSHSHFLGEKHNGVYVCIYTYIYILMPNPVLNQYLENNYRACECMYF